MLPLALSHARTHTHKHTHITQSLSLSLTLSRILAASLFALSLSLSLPLARALAIASARPPLSHSRPRHTKVQQLSGSERHHKPIHHPRRKPAGSRERKEPSQSAWIFPNKLPLSPAAFTKKHLDGRPFLLSASCQKNNRGTRQSHQARSIMLNLRCPVPGRRQQ